MSRQMDPTTYVDSVHKKWSKVSLKRGGWRSRRSNTSVMSLCGFMLIVCVLFIYFGPVETRQIAVACGGQDYTVTIDEPDENDVFLRGQEVRFESEVSPTPPAASYSWTVTQGTCSPSTGSAEDFVTTLSSQGNITVHLTVSINSNPYSTSRTVKTIVPEIIEVSFEQDYTITKYPSGPQISDPVWVKAFGGGVTKNDPAVYKKSDYARAKVKLQASDSLTNLTSAQLSGDGNTENFSALGVSLQNWPKVSGTLDSSQLYQSVNFYDTLNVTWRYRVANLSGGWGSWVNMNGSSHVIYITYNNPLESPLYDLALNKACHYAANQQSPSTVASQLCTGIDGDQQIYYNPSDDDENSNALQAYGESGGSVCLDLANLMRCLSRSIGIGASTELIWGGCASDTICLYIYQGWWGPSFRIIKSAHDAAPANPHFSYHADTLISGTYYDPSYGSVGLISLDETTPAHDPYPAATRQHSSSGWSHQHMVNWSCPH